MITRKNNGKGNRIPTVGIHVIKKQATRYANWKSVNETMCLNGTDSTKEGCAPSNTLSHKINDHEISICQIQNKKYRKKQIK